MTLWEGYHSVFSFHPLLIFSHITDALSHSFRTHCSNLPTPIVVDHGGNFGGASRALMCGKSTHIRSTWSTDDYTKVELLKTVDLVAPLIWGTWPGSSTLWLQYVEYGHLFEHEILKRFSPIGYSTVCCSYVEREDQFAPRSAINCSCRHVGEVKGVGKPWTKWMVSSWRLIHCDRGLMDGVKLTIKYTVVTAKVPYDPCGSHIPLTIANLILTLCQFDFANW